MWGGQVDCDISPAGRPKCGEGYLPGGWECGELCTLISGKLPAWGTGLLRGPSYPQPGGQWSHLLPQALRLLPPLPELP